MATYDCSMLAARPVVDSTSWRTRINSPRLVWPEDRERHWRQVGRLLLKLFVIRLYMVAYRRFCVPSSNSMAVKLLALSAHEPVVFCSEAPVISSSRDASLNVILRVLVWQQPEIASSRGCIII